MTLYIIDNKRPNREIKMTIKIRDENNKSVPVDFLQFSGGERHVQVNVERFGQLKKSVTIQAQITNSSDLMDYILLENVLMTQGLEISIEIPYFPYARQDRICATGQAFSLDVMTKLLNINTQQFPQQRKQITVWDAHSTVTEKLLNENTQFLKVVNISPSQIILQNSELINILTAENTVLICPDAGAKVRTQQIADTMNTLRDKPIEIIHCEKKRDALTGKILTTQVNCNHLTGKIAVICDDICDGGATFIGIAKALKQLNCEQIILYVTHGIFSKGLNVFNGLVNQIFTTNSIPQKIDPKLIDSKYPDVKLTIINFNSNI